MTPECFLHPSKVFKTAVWNYFNFPSLFSKFQLSLTPNKIPKLFLDLEDFFPLTISWPVATLISVIFYKKGKLAPYTNTTNKNILWQPCVSPTIPSRNLKISSQGGQNSQNQVSHWKLKISDGKNSVKYLAAITWNKISDILRSLSSLSVFKKAVRQLRF